VRVLDISIPVTLNFLVWSAVPHAWSFWTLLSSFFPPPAAHLPCCRLSMRHVRGPCSTETRREQTALGCERLKCDVTLPRQLPSGVMV
jgi:hypothetical protein